jgi:hypothetical protein
MIREVMNTQMNLIHFTILSCMFYANFFIKYIMLDLWVNLFKEVYRFGTIISS